MAKIDGLPRGACSKVFYALKEKGYSYSMSLIAAVAAGLRQNPIVEEELLKVKKEHQARLKRIERMKAKLDELQIGKIDTACRRDNKMQQ